MRNGMHYGLRAMLAMTLRQKKGELESKSSNKSDIWPSAASKKWVEIFGEYFSDLRNDFSIKGGGGAYTSCKHKYHNIYKNKDF